MKLTIISHFYNEEYLLPFWLKHYRNMFDDGVLIDWASTDNSVDICRELVPHWKVIPSRNKYYHRKDIESEIIDTEKSIKSDWKFSCTTTEFILNDNLRGYLETVPKRFDGLWIWPFCPVDTIEEEGMDVNQNIPLVLQRTIGALGPTEIRPTWKGRLIYRTEWGHWKGEGGHDSYLENTAACKNMFHIWFGFSPWNEKFIKRKLQIQDKMAQEYKSNDGVHELGYHITTREKLQQRYEEYRAKFQQNFFNNFDYLNSYVRTVKNLDKFI